MNRLDIKPQTQLVLGEALDLAQETKKGIIKTLMSFVVDCGLPQEIVQKLDGEGLEQIIAFMTPGKKN